MNVLLLNGENVQTICVARSLKQEGHNVVVFADSRLSSGYASRYIDEKYIAPYINNHPTEFNNYIQEYLASHNIDMIIPMGDESATFLSANKEFLERKYSCRCAVPSYAIFNLANDKQKLMQICEENQIPHPRTRIITIDNITEAIDYVGFPAMIKPNISAGAKGIVRVHNEDELRQKLPEILSQFGACTLQEYVHQPGYYYNVMMYRSKSGELSAYATIKIMRYFPLKGGSSCYCQTIDSEYLVNICAKVLEVLEWVGFADFDVLEDSETGAFKIIEINPRVPSSLQASSAAGIDFTKIILADEFDLPNPQHSYVAGREIRWFGLDVMWFLFSKERFSYRPSWFKFFGSNVSYQDGSLKDPLPMLMGCISGVLKYLNPRFRRSKLKG